MGSGFHPRAEGVTLCPSPGMSRSGEMQSVSCAAQPRSNTVAKREARATSIHGEGHSVTPAYAAFVTLFAFKHLVQT